MIPSHLIPTRKFNDGDQISDDPMQSDVFTVKTMEWNPVLQSWVYVINNAKGTTRWVEVDDCHRDYNPVYSFTVRLPDGVEFIPFYKRMGETLEVTVKDSCNHNWRPSSSVEGKSQWCSSCDERK